MKLIIQIPCYNEHRTLHVTLSELPRHVKGFDTVEWLVIDDGSTDYTSHVAAAYGVDHIVKHVKNKGLAQAFMTGLHTAIDLGADVIINTDADNQYSASSIPALVQPILDGNAEMVIGSRPISDIGHFSPIKKLLQKLGSWAVRVASNTDIPDAPSGFRAITREAAKRLVVFSDYTYTLETIIQAGQKNIAICSVPVAVNADLRPSRLVKSITSYVRRSIGTILRIFVVYRPFATFGGISAILLSVGSALGIRYLYYLFTDGGAGHVQSLILTSILLGAGFQTLLMAFQSDLIAANRKLLEDIRARSIENSGSWRKKDTWRD